MKYLSLALRNPIGELCIGAFVVSLSVAIGFLSRTFILDLQANIFDGTWGVF
jgi:hypothetical protein